MNPDLTSAGIQDGTAPVGLVRLVPFARWGAVPAARFGPGGCWGRRYPVVTEMDGELFRLLLLLSLAGLLISAAAPAAAVPRDRRGQRTTRNSGPDRSVSTVTAVKWA